MAAYTDVSIAVAGVFTRKSPMAFWKRAQVVAKTDFKWGCTSFVLLNFLCSTEYSLRISSLMAFDSQ